MAQAAPKKKTTRKKPEERAITWDQAYQSGGGFLQAPVSSGVHVNEQTAMGLSALWCGIRTISSDVGTLPPLLYSEADNGTRTPAKTHPLYRILRDKPNATMTRPVFWECMQAHALLYGNCYAEIERDGSGRPIALHPIHPSNVQVDADQGGNLVYRVRVEQGSADLKAEDVYHVPGLSPDGSVGYKLLTVAREAIGFGVAAQQYGSSFFGNAARPSGSLSVAGALSDVARENLRKSWAQLHSGPKNTGKVAILEEGLTFQPFQLTNEQNQYEALLRFFVFECARLLNIQPTKLMSLEKATWANLTELNRDYLQTTLRPWLVKHEAEAERKLLTEDERERYYVEFDATQLLRADKSGRYASYAVGIGAGFLTPDEARAEENMAPLPTEPTAVVEQIGADHEQPDQQPVDVVADVVPTDAAAVQDTALNGAQVASLMAICDKVAQKLYPVEAAKLLIKAAFPALSDDTINAFVNSLAAAPTPTTTEASNGTPINAI